MSVTSLDPPRLGIDSLHLKAETQRLLQRAMKHKPLLATIDIYLLVVVSFISHVLLHRSRNLFAARSGDTIPPTR